MGWGGWVCREVRRLALVARANRPCRSAMVGSRCHWWLVRRRSGRVRVCPLCRTLPVLRGLGVRSSSQRLGRGRWGRSRRCSFLVLRLCGGTLPVRGGRCPLVASVHRFLELFDDGFAIRRRLGRLVTPILFAGGRLFPSRGRKGHLLRMPAVPSPQPSP